MAIHLKGMTWDHARGYDPLIACSEQYSEHHPDVHFRWEKRSLQAFADRPLEAMTADYDLLVIDHPHAGAAAQSGLLASFNSSGRDAELAVLADQSCGVSHASYTFDGRQWGLAIDAAAPVSAYRPDLLDEVPSTWADVVRLAASGQVIWPLKPIDALMSFFNLLANVGEPFGANGAGVSPAAGRAVLHEMLAVARHVHDDCLAMNPIGAFEWLSCRASHAYVPFLYGYSNYARPGYRPFLVRVANIPALGDRGPIGSTLGGTGIAVSAASQHRDVSLDFAFWIASAALQRGTYFQAGGQPGNAVAWEDDAVNQASNNFFRDTHMTLNNAYLRPRHDGYLAFQDTASGLVHACLAGTATPATTVTQINEAYDRSLPA